MKLWLNFSLIVFICHVILSENLLKETEKDEKVTYRQHAITLFSILRLFLFPVINTFEESLHNNDMQIFYGISGVAKGNLFTACFYHFCSRARYLNSSSITCFSSEILLPFPNSIDLNSCVGPLIWPQDHHTQYSVWGGIQLIYNFK